MFTPEEIDKIFHARAKDNGTQVEDVALQRFRNYCGQHCVSRTVNFQNLMMKRHTLTLLSEIIRNTHAISNLNVRENMLKDQIVAVFANALAVNKSIVELDISQTNITPFGFKKLLTTLTSNESIISLKIGNPGTTSRNRMGD